MYDDHPIPPKSLQRLIKDLLPKQQAYVLAMRENLLCADENITEEGLSTRTLYGLRKNHNRVYRSKLCAEFIPVKPGIYRPRLRIRLPYPKREFGAPGNTYKPVPVKGLTWVEARHDKEWDEASEIRLLFYLSKGQRYSYALDLDAYTNIYLKLTGQDKSITSLPDLIALALQEWKYICFG